MLSAKRPIWMPDWSDEVCVIVASGPSVMHSLSDLAQCDAKIIAINDSWELAPWADMLYACDYAWWKNVGGLPGYTGIKVCGDARAASEDWDANCVRVLSHDLLVFDEPGTVGRGGGTSAFQALNIAVQAGCRRIVLLGVDCDISQGLHWHGAHPKGLSNPTQKLADQWRKALDNVAPILRQKNISVVNASPASTLTAYEKMPFNHALSAGLHETT